MELNGGAAGSGQQLGLHGHRRPGLEYPVRPDDAPDPEYIRMEFRRFIHSHPDPMPRHAPGSHHHPPADRLHSPHWTGLAIERTGFG